MSCDFPQDADPEGHLDGFARHYPSGRFPPHPPPVAMPSNRKGGNNWAAGTAGSASALGSDTRVSLIAPSTRNPLSTVRATGSG